MFMLRLRLIIYEDNEKNKKIKKRWETENIDSVERRWSSDTMPKAAANPEKAQSVPDNIHSEPSERIVEGRRH